jgi:predicted Zn-dependent protease
MPVWFLLGTRRHARFDDAHQRRQYGEMRSHLGSLRRRQAILYVRPDTHSKHKILGPAAVKDPLLRDTIVYLTCLHEIGHALGLGHTAAENDVMRTEGSAVNFDRYCDG